MVVLVCSRILLGKLKRETKEKKKKENEKRKKIEKSIGTI
jgi:hypothetical protein